jgi:hypothetical protein
MDIRVSVPQAVFTELTKFFMFCGVHSKANLYREQPGEETDEDVVDYLVHKVIPHKENVWEAGLALMQIGFSFDYDRDEFLRNLAYHDLTKFMPEEAIGYAQHDFSSGQYDVEFEKAWNHHKNHNPHHPEYWLSVDRRGEVTPLPMPAIYVLEMVADWVGAGKSYGGSIEEWLPKNLHKFVFHSETIVILDEILTKMGIPVRVTNGGFGITAENG